MMFSAKDKAVGERHNVNVSRKHMDKITNGGVVIK